MTECAPGICKIQNYRAPSTERRICLRVPRKTRSPRVQVCVCVFVCHSIHYSNSACRHARPVGVRSSYRTDAAHTFAHKLANIRTICIGMTRGEAERVYARNKGWHLLGEWLGEAVGYGVCMFFLFYFKIGPHMCTFEPVE